MKNIKLLIIPVLLAGSVAYGLQSPRPTLLRDGFVIGGIEGIEGSLKYSDSRDSWFFELAEDCSDDKAVVKAGTSLQLLPSAALQKMILDNKRNTAGTYRLWGRITKYKGVNYLYPIYFLSIIRPAGQATEQPQPAEESGPAAVADTNDPLALPAEIQERFSQTGATQIDPGQYTNTGRQLTEEEQEQLDSIPEEYMIVNKTAFLVDSNDGEFSFRLDYIGRNLSDVSYKLLPCELLELSENRQNAAYERLMFNITGVVSGYQGGEYLLLLKARRVYSNGNFNQ